MSVHSDLKEDEQGTSGSSELSGAETDRYGFLLGNGDTHSHSDDPCPQLVRHREMKWLSLMSQWDLVLEKKNSKIKTQCQKGIPASVRAKCWPLLCGATHQKEKNKKLYETLDLAPGQQSWIDVIKRDTDRQFPFHEMFLNKESHGQQGLLRVLKAYTQFRPDEGYCQAQGPVAAVLLMNMPIEEAFWCLVQISEHYLPGYYSPLLEGVLFDAAVLSGVLKKTCPAAHKHLQSQGVEPLMFATDWLMCLYSRHLPFNTLLRVWDLFFCYGVRVLFQVAVVLVRRCLGEARLRKECEGQMETLEILRSVRGRVQHEQTDAFIQEVCSVPLSFGELQRQTEKELQRWRKERPGSTFDPRGRCHGYLMVWEKWREKEKENEKKEKQSGNLTVPLTRSHSSLSPAILRKKWRKRGSKVETEEWEGGGRRFSQGVKDESSDGEQRRRSVCGTAGEIKANVAYEAGTRFQKEHKVTDTSLTQHRQLDTWSSSDLSDHSVLVFEEEESDGGDTTASAQKPGEREHVPKPTFRMKVEEVQTGTEQKDAEATCDAHTHTEDEIKESERDRDEKDKEMSSDQEETQLESHTLTSQQEEETQLEEMVGHSHEEERKLESKQEQELQETSPLETAEDNRRLDEEVTDNNTSQQYPQLEGLKVNSSEENNNPVEEELNISEEENDRQVESREGEEIIEVHREAQEEEIKLDSSKQDEEIEIQTTTQEENIHLELDSYEKAELNSNKQENETEGSEEQTCSKHKYKQEASNDEEERINVVHTVRDEQDTPEETQEDTQETNKEQHVDPQISEEQEDSELRVHKEDGVQEGELDMEHVDTGPGGESTEGEHTQEGHVAERDHSEAQMTDKPEDGEERDSSGHTVDEDMSQTVATSSTTPSVTPQMTETEPSRITSQVEDPKLEAGITADEVVSHEAFNVIKTQPEGELEHSETAAPSQEVGSALHTEENPHLEAENMSHSPTLINIQQEADPEASGFCESIEVEHIPDLEVDPTVDEDKNVPHTVEMSSSTLTNRKGDTEPETPGSSEPPDVEQIPNLKVDLTVDKDKDVSHTVETSSSTLKCQEDTEPEPSGPSESQSKGDPTVDNDMSDTVDVSSLTLTNNQQDTEPEPTGPPEFPEVVDSPPQIDNCVPTVPEVQPGNSEPQPSSEVVAAKDEPQESESVSVQPHTSTAGDPPKPPSSSSNLHPHLRLRRSSSSQSYPTILSEDTFRDPHQSDKQEQTTNTDAASSPDPSQKTQPPEPAAKPKTQVTKPKRRGLFHRFRGETPPVPKILIQDFSEGEEKLSSKERRRRRREQERREKEEEKERKKREKELEKEKEKERKKPQTRGKSFQVLSRKSEENEVTSGNSSSNRNSAPHSESYF